MPFFFNFLLLQPFQPVRRVFSPTPEQTRFVQRQLPYVANAQVPQIPEARTQSNVEREEEKLKVLHKAEKAAQYWERRYITTKNVLDSTNIQLGQARIELDQLKMEVVRKRKQNRRVPSIGAVADELKLTLQRERNEYQAHNKSLASRLNTRQQRVEALEARILILEDALREEMKH
jgi:ribosomal protein L39E